MVEVESPGTLSAGYVFQATYNGVIFPVTVVREVKGTRWYRTIVLRLVLLIPSRFPFRTSKPPGGVTEGQKIVVPFTNHETTSELTPLAAIDTAPHGHWKDGLCDCCKYGPLHPALCNAFFCPQILMGQVLTRMRMDWLGSPATEYDWQMTFRRIAIIVIVYYVLSLILQPDSTEVIMADDETVTVIHHEGPLWKSILYNVLSCSFGLYTLIVMVRLRAAVRAKYEIPTKQCGKMEDCCCVVFCGCCTVSQMARQTANYEEIRAVCCTDTGLPPSMQTIIV
jgi:Cys-rich protein (TIGR01571 family)